MIMLYALYRENFHPQKMFETIQKEIETGSKTLDVGTLSKYLVEEVFGKLDHIDNKTGNKNDEDETYKDKITNHITDNEVVSKKNEKITMPNNYLVLMLIKMGLFKLHPSVLKNIGQKEKKLTTAELVNKITGQNKEY